MPPNGQPNPFADDFGKEPAFLAGRQHLLDRFEELIRDLVDPAGRHRRGTLLIGPRGCGKTVLLNELEKIARSNKIAVYSVLQDGGFPADCAELAERLRKPSKEYSATAGVDVESLTGHRIKPFVQGRLKSSKHPTFIVKALTDYAQGKPLLLILDEIHEAPEALLQGLLQTLQVHDRDPHPVIVAAAGTPDAKLHLQAARVSFFERADIHRIGLLGEADAMASLTRPFADARPVIAFDPAVAARAAREGQFYPYFLQGIGKELWRARTASGAAAVTDDILDQALTNTLRSQQELYDSRITMMNRFGILPGAAEIFLQANASGTPSGSAIHSFISNLADRWHFSDQPPPRSLSVENLKTSAEQLLLHTCFAWQPDPGTDRWEFGIPSLASNVTQAAADLVLEALPGHDPGLALRSLLAQAGQLVTYKTLVADAAQALDGLEGDATKFVNAMIDAGVVGRLRSHDPDQPTAYTILTPKLLAHTLDAPDREHTVLRPRPSPPPAKPRREPAPKPATDNAGPRPRRRTRKKTRVR